MGYPAVWQVKTFPGWAKRCASTVTSENKPNQAGVVRAIARADHLREQIQYGNLGNVALAEGDYAGAARASQLCFCLTPSRAWPVF